MAVASVPMPKSIIPTMVNCQALTCNFHKEILFFRARKFHAKNSTRAPRTQGAGVRVRAVTRAWVLYIHAAVTGTAQQKTNQFRCGIIGSPCKPHAVPGGQPYASACRKRDHDRQLIITHKPALIRDEITAIQMAEIHGQTFPNRVHFPPPETVPPFPTSDASYNM